MTHDAYYLHFPNRDVLEDVDLYVLSNEVYHHVDTLPLSAVLARVNNMKEQKPQLFLLRIQVGGISLKGEFV